MHRQEPISIEKLRANIALTNADLNQLAHNHQKFVGTIRNLNNEAKNKILIDSPKIALVYLNEAEKILEYAASCGKNIDRKMIMCILHNEACCYQKLWELQKCSNYLEALIFNISSHLKTSTPSPREVEDYIKTSGSLSSHLRDSLYGKPINQRIQLSKYHLQFCAINSQLRNHKGALISGRRAIGIIKDIFQELQTLSIQKSTIQNNYSPASLAPEQLSSDYKKKLHIIAGVASMNDEPNLSRLDEYIVTAKFYFRKWNIRKLEHSNERMKQQLKNFSIGNIMQMKPISFEENRQSTMDNDHIMAAIYQDKFHADLLKTENLSKVIDHTLLLTISYFTIATQLRLIAAEKYRSNDQLRKSSPEHLQSQIYHIIALIITCIYVPYDMVYMRHIVTSFSNHYSGNLNESISNSQNESRIMSKQFDPCFFIDNKKRKGDTKTSIIKKQNQQYQNCTQTGQISSKGTTHIIESKSYSKGKKKNNYKSKPKKQKESQKMLKNSRIKERVNSEELIKIEESYSGNRAQQITETYKCEEKKQKIRSMPHKNRKSKSNNNSKTKKKDKEVVTPHKHHNQYKLRKNLNRSKSPRGTFNHRQQGSKLIRKGNNKGEQGANKISNHPSKKALKKNLDKYYF